MKFSKSYIICKRVYTHIFYSRIILKYILYFGESSFASSESVANRRHVSVNSFFLCSNSENHHLETSFCILLRNLLINIFQIHFHAYRGFSCVNKIVTVESDLSIRDHVDADFVISLEFLHKSS